MISRTFGQITLSLRLLRTVCVWSVASLWVVCGISASCQIENASENPPFQGKYWLYHHYIDKDELAFIKNLVKGLQSENDLKPAESGYADKILGIKTTKIECPTFLIESDSLSEEELRIIGSYAECARRLIIEICGEHLPSLEPIRKYNYFLLKHDNYRIFSEKTAKDQETARFRNSCYGFDDVQDGIFTLCEKSCYGDPRTEAFASGGQVLFYVGNHLSLASSSNSTYHGRFSIMLWRAVGILFRTQSGARQVKIEETSLQKFVYGHAFPDWNDKVYRHYFPVKAPGVTVTNPDGSQKTVEPKQEEPKEIYRIKHIIEGPLDSMDETITVKLWAFCDWLLISQRDKLKAYVKEAQTRSTALAKDNSGKPLSLEQTKRVIVESLEAVFAKSMDAIEDDFKSYVKERYMPLADAKKFEKSALWKHIDYKEGK